MKVFVTGGCKSGKSYKAQVIARDISRKENTPLYYVATMIPSDEEDMRRVERHVAERKGWGFRTVEQGRDISNILAGDGVKSEGTFLIDSVTALLSNEMFDEKGEADGCAVRRVKAGLLRFGRETGNTVFVSDHICGDGSGYDDLTENFRRGLAAIDKFLAEECNKVIEVSAGISEIWK